MRTERTNKNRRFGPKPASDRPSRGKAGKEGGEKRRFGSKPGADRRGDGEGRRFEGREDRRGDKGEKRRTSFHQDSSRPDRGEPRKDRGDRRFGPKPAFDRTRREDGDEREGYRGGWRGEKRDDRRDERRPARRDGGRNERGEGREEKRGFTPRSSGERPGRTDVSGGRRFEGRSEGRKEGRKEFRGPRTGRREAFRPANDQQEKRPAIQTGGQVLFGFHAVSAAWLNEKRKCLRLFLTEAGQKNFQSTLAEAEKHGLKRPKPEIVEGKTLDRLTGANAVHQGIVLDAEALPDMEIEDLLAADPLPNCIIMLDQVTDPHNVGAILRTACAFGAGAVLMTDRHAASATGTLAKTASGALEHTPLIRVANLAQAMAKLQKEGYWCIGLDESGASALHEIKMPQRVALVLGAEGEGLRRLTRESCDEIAKLPTHPPIGSLNVSNAAAVAIYEVLRNRS